ncbi:MAG: hypothetical protein OSB41_12770 [Kiritimatiellae bacterium]|nr:hypothetical protein [Kiritimatiellia bacterium]
MDSFGEIKAQLTRTGTAVDDFDLLIGCTAMALNYTVVTNNTKHYEKTPGLNVVNWALPESMQARHPHYPLPFWAF